MKKPMSNSSVIPMPPCICTDADAVEAEARGIMRVDHRHALGLDALRFRVDEEQRQSFRIASGDRGITRRARGSRHYDDEIRDVPIEDECLRAVERVAIA